MCTEGDGIPGSMAEALGMMESALDFLSGPGGADGAAVPALGEALQALTRIGSKHSAVWNAFLSRFDANSGHDADGYQTSAAWLSGKTQTTLPAARGKVKAMRQLTGRPLLDAAMTGGLLSDSWAAQVIKWSKPLPAELHESLDRLLLTAIGSGATLEDLAVIIAAMIEEWRQQRPDPDEPDDGFEDRRVTLGHTFGAAGRLTGDLTPECAAAVQAVLDSLGKKRGREDTRTQGQRFHDALQEGCELLLRARLVPDRAGADTRVDAVMSLAALRGMDGASLLENAWLAAGAEAGHHIFVSGKAAEALSCDALLTPVVTGGADWPVIGQMVELVLDALGRHGRAADPHGTGTASGDEDSCHAGSGNGDGGSGNGDGGAGTGALPGPPPALPLPPEAWQALLYAMAKLAIGFVSGPGGLASALRAGLMPAPWNSRSVPLDVGWSENIPEPIRRAVMLRDRRCRWPGGCDRRPAVCDVHHVRHKKHGGHTSVDSCLLLCQFHHDICVHRWGWEIELLPDGEVQATGPYGQVLRSRAPPGTGPPELARPA